MKVKQFKSRSTVLLFVIIVIVSIAGRVNTFNLTEGQVFIDGFWYWVAATFCAILILIIQLLPEKRSNSWK